MKSLPLHHLSRLSDNVDVLVIARRINSQFRRTGLTELLKLDCECEAVYLGPKDNPLSIIVFYRLEIDESVEYYMSIVWTAPKFRGLGCYERLLNWLKDYAKGKGASRLSTDVHHDNKKMIEHKRHWEKTFVRFNLPI